MCNRV